VSHPNDPYVEGGGPPVQGGQGGGQPYGSGQQIPPYGAGPYGQGGHPYPGGQNPYGGYGQAGQQVGPPPGAWYGPGQPQGGYGPPTQEQPAFGPPTQQYPAYGPLPYQPAPPRRTGLVVGSLVAVMALAAAGIATYFLAFAGSAAGSPSPKEAAVSLVTALSKNDVVGLLDGLAPAEGAVAKDYLTETLDELERLEVVKPGTRPDQLTGFAFKAENLVFDDNAEERVNDHLAITKLVDGTITISSDWSKVPLTEKFLRTAFPDGVPANETRTIDISDEIEKGNDGKPVRIATVKVGGQWYPSLLYSIADAAVQEQGKSWPAQAIGATGADSPEAAVRQLVEAVLRADAKRAIELTPPDEMAALHDAGQLVVEAAGDNDPAEVTITELSTKVGDATGGKRVSLSKLAAKNGDGQTITVEVDGDCVRIDNDGDRQKLCGKDLAEMVADLAELSGSDLDDRQLKAIERIAVGYLHSGLVTTKVDGRWYVSPARSLGDFSSGFLRELQPGDLETLIELFR
jgi:hypothetical protein